MSNVQSQWLNGHDDQDGYAIVLNTTVASGAQAFAALSALVQTADGARMTKVGAVASQVAGVETYHLLLGTEKTSLVPGTYTITLYGTPAAGGDAVLVDSFSYTVTALGSSAPSAVQTFNDVSWADPLQSTDAVWLVVNGKTASSRQVAGATIYNASALTAGSSATSIAYGQAVGSAHSASVSASQAMEPVTVNAPTGKYNVNVSVLNNNVPAGVVSAKGLYIGYNGTVAAMPLAGGQFVAELAALAAGQYAYTVYGLNAQDQQVVVGSGTYSAPGAAQADGAGRVMTELGAVTFGSTVQMGSCVEMRPIPNTNDLAFSVSLGADEVDSMAGRLQVQLSCYATGAVVDVAVSGANGAYSAHSRVLTNTSAEANQYEVKMWYVNKQGQTVIVNWFQYDPTRNWAVSGIQSSAIVARETGGRIDNGGGTLANVAGLNTGGIAGAAQTYQLELRQTGNASGGRSTDGVAAGYYAYSQYDAMGYLVTGNGADGLWHTYWVDAGGNMVASANWGFSATALLSGTSARATPWNQAPAAVLAGHPGLAPLSEPTRCSTARAGWWPASVRRSRPWPAAGRRRPKPSATSR